MYSGRSVALVIPALDEEQAIGALLSRVDRTLVDRIVVADNGSKDATAQRAAEHGALVVREPRRGYGSACLRALRETQDIDLIVFMDADGSDDPDQIEPLLARLLDTGSDLVIGSRVLGQADRGALTPIQRYGNALACSLVRWFWGVEYTDLGPFRAIRREALERLEMSDPDFGWTIEMQVKAAQRRLRTCELPVRCHVRAAGRSKVSGTVSGVVRAGSRILGYVFEARVREWLGR